MNEYFYLQIYKKSAETFGGFIFLPTFALIKNAKRYEIR